MPETSKRWIYPLTSVTADKEGARSGAKMGRAWELKGVDGTIDGGLRPFQGFIKVETFDPKAESSNTNLANGVAYGSLTGGKWGTTTPEAEAAVAQFWPVSFRVDVQGVAYGAVFRVNNGLAGGGADSIHIAYRLDADASLRVREIIRTVPVSAQVDVVVLGRLVYVLVEGQTPTRFYVLATGGSPAYDDRFDPDFRAGTPLPPGPGKQPLLVANTADDGGAGGKDTLTSGYTGDAILYKTNTVSTSNANLPSSPAHPQKATNNSSKLEAGDYGFAYQLQDSKTGLRSALSKIATLKYADFSSAASRYVVMEIVYDTSKWDQLLVYRTPRLQDMGGVVSASLLFLDRLLTLATYVGTDPPSAPLGKAYYYYEPDDKVLVSQDVYLDRPTFDEQMPPGGSGVVYEGTLVVGKLKKPAGEAVGVGTLAIGETKWSSLTGPLPELFNPASVYVPASPTNAVTRFVKVSGNVIGFSVDRQYYVRRDTVYIRLHEMHEGYGVVSPRAAAVVGSTIFFLTNKGIKAVNAAGELDDVRAMNYLTMEQWKGNLVGTSMAYDARTNAVIALCPALRQAAVLWIGTQKFTEIDDAGFAQVETGVWPGNPTSVLSATTNPLVSRALWMQPLGVGATATARLFVIDADRQKTVKGTMLDGATGVRLAVSGVSSNTVTCGAAVGAGWEGANVYVVGGPRHGLKNEIVSISGSTFTTTATPVMQAGDRVLISPVYMRWTGYMVGLFQDSADEAASINFFRVRKLSSLGAAFTNVSGNANATTDALAVFQVFNGNNSTYSARGLPTDTTGTKATNIRNDEPFLVASLNTPDSGGTSPLQGKFAFVSADPFPALEVIACELDFRVMGVFVDGDITDMQRSGKGYTV